MMSQLESLSVIVPSRGRPESMIRLAQAFGETCRDSTTLHWVIDMDDPSLEAYRQAYNDTEYVFQALWVVPKGRPGIVHPLNYVADEVFNPKHGFYPSILGFMGDDHVPRTEGWDVEIEQSLSSPTHTGIAYGNDLYQGPNLPTAAFVTRDIVQTLGFMAPDELDHLYVDDYWRDLGRGAGCLKYLPEVVIEHLHYSIGKSEKDETYSTVNSSAVAKHDREAYALYKSSGRLGEDIDTVRGIEPL